MHSFTSGQFKKVCTEQEDPAIFNLKLLTGQQQVNT